MARLDPNRVADFDRNVQRDLNRLAALYRKKDLPGLVERTGKNARLVVLDDHPILAGGPVFEGERQIGDFWKGLYSAGVTRISFKIRKKSARAADFLMPVVGLKGAYVLYDMLHYSFGTYLFTVVKPNPGTSQQTGTFLLISGHPVTCQREPLNLVLG